MNLEDREEMEALAGEYVLGVMSIDEAAEIERALPGNPELRRAVYYWENQLVNLTALAAPMEPETDLWQRIERDLPRKAPLHSQAAHVDSRQPGIWRSLSFWRFTSLAGFAATAVLMWLGFVAPQPAFDAPAYTAVLQAPDKSAGYLVQADARGGVQLTPLAATSPAPNQALQFWTKQEGARGPTSLGLVPANKSVRIPADRLPGLEPNQLFEITLEPAGGSTIGRPTGPILFVGRTVKPI